MSRNFATLSGFMVLSLLFLSFASWDAPMAVRNGMDLRADGRTDMAIERSAAVTLPLAPYSPSPSLTLAADDGPSPFHELPFSMGSLKGHALWDTRSCTGIVRITRAASTCDINSDWTKDSTFAAKYNKRFGPDSFRIRLLGREVLGAATDPSSPHHLGDCRYEIPFGHPTLPKGQYQLHVMLIHERYNAMKDTAVAWYPMALTTLLGPVPSSVVTCHAHHTSGGNTAVLPVCRSPVTEGRWVRVTADATNYKTIPSLGGYWLPLKPHQGRDDPFGKSEDILGRQNLGFTFEWRPRRCIQSPCSTLSCLHEALRGLQVIFLGDSHMRTTFYGLLTQLQVPYSPNRIWRGDRVDHIASANLTLRYVANYFLNLSRPTAVEALQWAHQNPQRTILVIGVGQHHASFCWPIADHVANVRSALQTVRALSVVWIGIPATPLNTHIHRVQHRKDCRNNHRLLMYNEAQREVVVEHGFPFVDTFLTSYTMSHTTLDGAHYYTWVRDQWLTDIVGAIRNRKKLE